MVSGRAPTHLLAGLKTQNSEPDRRWRRPVCPDELARIVAAAEGGPDLYGVPGTTRALVYALAGTTGFRAGDIRSLTVRSFDLDAATVTVEARHTKSKRTRTNPLKAELADRLRAHLAGRAADEPAFALPPVWTFARMLRADAKAAGINTRGMTFHGLRHGFITALARSGVHPSVVQRLAGHSDIRLTMQTYTHIRLEDLHKAVDSLALPLAQTSGFSGQRPSTPCAAAAAKPAQRPKPGKAANRVEMGGPAQTGTDGPWGSPGGKVARPAGLEPATSGFVGRYSIRLSYGRTRSPWRQYSLSPRPGCQGPTAV